jgi:DNA-binding transcriptional LysR family regulator
LLLEAAKMQPMSWDDLRVFLAVVRRGSHKAAARSLGVNPTTVGRRLAALEAELGQRLLERSPERLSPTAAGRTLLARAERVEAEMQALSRELSGADTSLAGRLRVTATDGLAHYLLVPALGQLQREHPGLSLDLRIDARLSDLSRHEADVALRLLRPREPSLVARPVGRLHFGLYASPTYLERRGMPRSVAALAAHDWVGFDAGGARLPQLTWLRRAVPGARYVLRVNTTTAQALACAEGLGVALLPTFTAEREPRLRPLLPRLEGPSRDLFVVYHADLRANPRVSAFTSWLGRLLSGATSA